MTLEAAAGAGAASGATPPAAAGAGAQPPASAPPATPPAAGAGAQPPATDAWLAALSPENRGHVQAKGARDANAIVESWKAAEKLTGYPKERLLALPDPAATGAKGFEDFAEVFARLGAPADAKEYGLTPDAGTPPEFTNGMAEILKAAKVTKDQAAVLVPKYGELVKGLTAATKAASDAKMVADKQALATKWGAAHDQNTAIAKNVARKFGVTEEAIRALDSVTGHVPLMEFLYNIGRGLGEHNFVEGQPGVGLVTPEQAKTERENSMADKSTGGWTERYLKGGAKEKAQMQAWLAAEAGIDIRELK